MNIAIHLAESSIISKNHLHLCTKCTSLLTSHLLGQCRVLLLESQADSLRVLEELLRALEHTRLLFRAEFLGGEVLDTVGEAALDKV